MPFIRVYADVHDSEDYAKGIHREVKQQSPEGLFLESHEKENATYLLQSLMKYPTLESISRNLEIDYTSVGIPEEKYQKGLYTLQYKVVKRALEASLKFKSGGTVSNQGMNAIKSPDQTWKSEEVDQAVNSLLHQMSVRESGDRSTIWSRLAIIGRKSSVETHIIDMERQRIWNHGAKNIPMLPNNPGAVKQIVNKLRKDRGASKKEKLAVNKLLKSTDNVRDKVMAIQVKKVVSEKGLSNSAVVVGRAHTDGVARALNQEFDVEEKDVGRSGLI